MAQLLHGLARLQFQSTLPARGATYSGKPAYASGIYFNPRSPRGERPAKRVSPSPVWIFQSTLPARGATYVWCKSCRREYISIHAPREGSDSIDSNLRMVASYFNPRSPRGERLFYLHFDAVRVIFQSTLPARGATELRKDIATLADLFQSTLPARGATKGEIKDLSERSISIHAPREGSDVLYRLQSVTDGVFQSTLPARGATAILHRYSRSERQYCNTVTKRGLSSGRKASF